MTEPKKYAQPRHIRISDELWARVQAAAKKRRQHIYAVIEDCIELGTEAVEDDKEGSH